MRLSTRSTYGMRALVELALTAGHEPVSAAFIAKRQALSVAYLEQLLHRLKRQGLVNSMRGPRGGYLLAKDPREITMADIVGTLDGAEPVERSTGRASLARVLDHQLPRPFANGMGRARQAQVKGTQRHAQRIAQAVRRCVHERLTQSLGGVTLQDLCEEVRADTGEPLDQRDGDM